ncbi:hypothetical protein F5146DRAFT_1135539 [Armillaria mellea]|nr:hypothetical protein F5146DRAFT_1135539 [Armillaria mellea]
MSPDELSYHRSPSRVFCFFITAVSFIIAVPTVWITSALQLRNVGHRYYVADSENTNRSLTLFANLVSTDLIHGTVVAEWTVEKDTCTDSNCTDVRIFIDTRPPPSDPRYESGSYNDNALTVPNSTWNATLLGTRRRRGGLSFRTPLTLYTSNDYQDYYSGTSYEDRLLYYPFDRYETQISAFARDASTNESVSLQFYSGSGFIVNLQFSIAPAGPPRWQETDQIWDTDLSLRRNTLVILYCLVITLTFWLVTIMICLIMIATVVFGFRQRNEIVIIPITTVFPLPNFDLPCPELQKGLAMSLVYPLHINIS